MSETKRRAGRFFSSHFFLSQASCLLLLKIILLVNNENVHKNSFIGLKTFFLLFILFLLLPGASLLPTYLCTLVLGMLLVSLLHTVLDGGGPRKWSYEEPSKPMTYKHAPRH